MSSNPNPNFDERRWIINIRRTFEEELEDESQIPVSIFSVPKTLMLSDPNSYTPQEVAIGPYHHWRPELYEMERYKLAAAKRAERQLHGDLKFQCVVDQLIELEPLIRASYHKFLNLSSETVAWMMAIDASFLLEFLQIYAIKECKLSTSSSSRSMSHLLDYAGTKAAHNAILRDMVMLENQIPLFVLRKMLEVEYSSSESADEILQAMLVGFCEELSPFKMMKINMASSNVSKSTHLLDYLYDTIVPRAEQKAETKEVDQDQSEAKRSKERDSGDPTNVKKFFIEFWKLLWKMNKGPVRLIKKLLLSKPVKVLFKLPWIMLSKIPGISILAQPVQYLLFSQKNEEKKSDNDSHSSNDTNKPPLVEEIAIPSVTELAKSQVRFSATAGNISTVSFDAKTATLHLPTISLDVNSELIMRNLVAYEASNASGPLVLTRYTELMNGIIDTEEDVKLLRERGIILNRLKSDLEVANLWNGMSKSIRLTKVPHMDKAIEGANKYYNSQWKVKLRKNIKFYVFGSWQFLTLLATIMLMLLMTLQAFCSVYHCRKFNIGSSFD